MKLKGETIVTSKCACKIFAAIKRETTAAGVGSFCPSSERVFTFHWQRDGEEDRGPVVAAIMVSMLFGRATWWCVEVTVDGDEIAMVLPLSKRPIVEMITSVHSMLDDETELDIVVEILNVKFNKRSTKFATVTDYSPCCSFRDSCRRHPIQIHNICG